MTATATSAAALPENILKLNRDIARFPQVKPVTPDMKIVRKGVSRTVMLDRYTFKDSLKITLGVGDLVVLTYREDPKWPGRGYGEVIDIDYNEKTVTVKLAEEFNNGEIVTKPIAKVDKPLEIYYEQICDRVARGLASPESPEKFWEVKEAFYQELVSENFVPAGRVLHGAGSDTDVTYFNCYVMPFVHDSRGGIGDHRKKVMEIMSRGGGVGTNGSTLRPRDTFCHGVNGRSSGAVTWLDDLSQLTNLVEQGGSRRGAQMIMLNDWHPDIVEFIVSKMQNPKILKFIAKKTKSSLIKEEVQRKLKFTPLSEVERHIYQETVYAYEDYQKRGMKQSDQADKAYAYAQERLEDGGVYSVYKPDFLSGANISVNITKDFMEAVEKKGKHKLRFPHLDEYDADMRKIYNEEWAEIGDVREWERRGYGVKVYHEIDAADLWQLINICATYSAEPGIFFIDNANDMTNAKAYGQQVVATNPCGEQPLAPFSVCNLAAVNLAEMARDGVVDYEKLKRTVEVGIRMQDNVISATPYFMEENTKQALGERRIGLGVMGLHDLLIRAGYRYGSVEGNEVVDKVFETIATTAYRASIELAKEKGSFPFLEVLANGEKNIGGREKFIHSGYMKKMPEDIREGVLEHGIRNSHLLTIAPTGSTGTMVNVSTGLEPYFGFVYFRSGRLGKFIPVVADIALEWLEKAGYTVTEENVNEMIAKLPKHFVPAMELSPEEHADTQCVIQRWIDSSISKTVNAPAGYSVSQVAAVYERLWKGGAKGGTVYVDGSRDAQVLSLTNEENDFDKVEVDVLTLDIPVERTIVEVNIEPEKKLGTDVGDTCIICEIGTLKDAGGCATCDNCGSQLKCGL